MNMLKVDWHQYMLQDQGDGEFIRYVYSYNPNAYTEGQSGNKYYEKA